LPDEGFFPQFSDDDFEVIAAEPWFKVKVQVIERYFHSFITKMAGRADEIIVLDLFAGAGFYSVGYQRQLVPSASFACLAQRLPVKRWILAESNPDLFKALKIRVGRYFRDQPILLQEREPADMIEKAKLYVPPRASGTKAALLTLLDPFAMIPFDYIERLHWLGSSFIMPYAFPLSDRFGYARYLHEERQSLSAFLRQSELTGEFQSNEQFYKRAVQTHQRHIMALGLGVSTSYHRLESKIMDLPSFAVSFFSGRVEAKNVQKEYVASAAKQYDLFN
jgi:three-Cys-motif partner protein